MNRYVCIKAYMLYILPEISAHHLQLKCMGGHFFPCHPYIESTIVLSDILSYCLIAVRQYFATAIILADQNHAI